MTLRPRKVHLLFRGSALCGITDTLQRKGKQKNRPMVTTTDAHQVNCVSCRKAADRALRTTHKNFLSFLKSKRKLEEELA